MPQHYETLLIDDPQPGVLRVTLNRPAVANAFNTQMMRDLLNTPRITVADRGLREGMLVRLMRADRRRSSHSYLRRPVLGNPALNGARLIT